MIRIPLVYMKDKQFYTKRDGVMRILGNAVEVAKKLGSEYKLIHIVDLDLKKGSNANFDTYDKMTYFVNIEVECIENSVFVKRLLEIKSRVVLDLPTKLELEKWKDQERLLVGRITAGYSGKAEGVHDVIIEKPEDAERFAEKRIIAYEGFRGKAWGIIFSPEP